MRIVFQKNLCRIAIFVLTTFFLICSCKPENAASRALKDATILAKQGDYEGALAKHVWFHDNALKAEPGYYGVRLSFALGEWIELGNVYPKALEKLKAIRDEKTARLSGDSGDPELFHDVEAINGYLGESAATVALFKKIDATRPAFASSVYHIAEVALVESGEYALARKYLGDPQKRLQSAIRNYREGLKYSKSGSRDGDASRHAFESNFADDIVRIVTVLRETGDKAGAKSIQAEALKTLDDGRMRNAFKE